MCRHCRRYAAQISAIGEAARSVFWEKGEDAQALERMRERILTNGRPGPTPDTLKYRASVEQDGDEKGNDREG